MRSIGNNYFDFHLVLQKKDMGKPSFFYGKITKAIVLLNPYTVLKCL